MNNYKITFSMTERLKKMSRYKEEISIHISKDEIVTIEKPEFNDGRRDYCEYIWKCILEEMEEMGFEKVEKLKKPGFPRNIYWHKFKLP